jgi:hypothetical protein
MYVCMYVRTYICMYFIKLGQDIDYILFFRLCMFSFPAYQYFNWE